MAGNVVSNVKKYYGGQVPVPGQGDSDGKVKVLVEKTATIEIEGVQTEVELLYDADDLTTPVTPQQLGQWTDENYLIAFKYRNDEGVVRGFILYALETDSTSADTLVNRAAFVNFKEDMIDPGASAYMFEMVEDSSSLTRYLRDSDGELIVKFNQSSVEAGAQSGTLDHLITSDSTYMDFEVVHEGDNAYLNLNTESLDKELEDIWEKITDIIDAIDELPSDEHGYFNSTLIQTPGDGTTENIVIDDFRISQGRDVHGDNIEFVPTHQEGGIDFGNVYLEPGTYILAIQYTLQWVGNPRGTFLPKVCSVADQPFDFSYEHEDVIRVTRIVTKTTRGKLVTNIAIDADTPSMGVWVKSMEVAQIASYNHPAVTHDSTLTGSGQLDDPIGVTPAAFGKVKDIPTSISQFRTGDVIPVDGPNGPAKMPKDDLLTETAQSTLAGNLAPAFVPNSTTTVAGQPYIYDGLLYIAKEVYQGAWDASKFDQTDVQSMLSERLHIVPKQIYGSNVDNLDDLNNADANSVYVISRDNNTTTANFPSDFMGVGFLFTAKANFASYGHFVYQVLFDFMKGHSWQRVYNSLTGTWSDWNYNYNTAVNPKQIFAGWSGNLGDLNDAVVGNIYILQPTSSTTTRHMPSDYPNKIGMLISGKAFYHSAHYQIWQIIVCVENGFMWYRAYNSSGATWSSWSKSSMVSVNPNQIFAAWNQNLSDLNDAEVNTTYIVARTSDTTTQHFPSDFGPNQGRLSTYKAFYATYAYQIYQVLERFTDNALYFRAYNSAGSSWTAWIKASVYTGRERIYVGSGQIYTTLRSGLEYAFNTQNVDVIVMPGTYDLYAEYADLLETVTGSLGAPLGHNMKVFFVPGSKVIANCTKGSLTDEQWKNVNLYFNPLQALGSDFEIENLDMEATDCRYCVHDECNGIHTPYSHTYKNCRMVKHCTSNVTPGCQFTQCIGGGFGDHATINIDGGWYKSEAVYGYSLIDDGNVAQNQMCISYHNGRGAGIQSVVFIKDVYIDDRGYVGVIDLDESTNVSQFYICGCSLGLATQHQEGPVHNTHFTQWNCDVRNPGTWVPSGNNDWRVDFVTT